MPLYIGNDSIVELTGLYDQLTGNYVNNASVQCTVFDANGGALANVGWPIALNYLAASNGVYQGIIPATIQLAEASGYRAQVIATSGSTTAEWDIPVLGQYREC